MSKQSYSEYEMSDDEITELLDEMYPDNVIVCGMPMSQSYILKHMDRVAFDSFGSDEMKWQCDVCNKIHNEENDAKECCQEYCDNCGADLDDGESGLCQSCQDEEDSENEEGEK